MAQRTDLHAVLCGLQSGLKVYYQPPTGLSLTFPCIVYEKSSRKTYHANDKPYVWADTYSVTLITRTVDDPLVDMISAIRGTRFSRTFVNDNLYHYNFEINY